eukprot:TRINITY_DN16_c0_g1_i1.p1 TRINITY_DN16_c0_g1~~TRINITY_DN16_c0_g1_i1.p1  ORF type:complete len:594 (+),score=195.56 TRINITY_DN16_c0_g1_i1:96-1877(+)
MPRGKHSKDRMFVTATEWSRDYGGKKGAVNSGIRPLSFDCCAMSLGPFETPVCTKEGVVFDILNVMPYVKKHKKNPVTGEPLKNKDLIQLHFAKNNEGKWHCPVTFKVFNDNSRIVAVRTTGNVYAAEAVEELNLKTKNFEDLLTGEPFQRADIIKLNDPADEALCALRDANNFKHLKELREAEAKRQEQASHTSKIRQTLTTQQIFKEIEEKRQSDERDRTAAAAVAAAAAAAKDAEAVAAGAPLWKRRRVLLEDISEGTHVTTNVMAGSFTSTAQQVSTTAQSREATTEEIDRARFSRLRALKKKGYVQLQTSHGNINIEVHVDMVPKTAENFLGLCEKGYYDGTIFHRSIRHFVIQGGDPTGTGTGGESIWGEKFRDEFDERLSHDKRGILAMANSGPHTNASQFYITYKSCKHLDRKHSVFGSVVGGLATLGNMEAVPTDKADKPEREITLLKAIVLQNPIPEMEAALEAELVQKMAEREAKNKPKLIKSGAGNESGERVGWASNPRPALLDGSAKAGGDDLLGVGKYIGKSTVLPKREAKSNAKGGSAAAAASAMPDFEGAAAEATAAATAGAKRKAQGSSFGDFSGW